MKKMAILVALLLCVGTAFAAEWPDGCSPSKPYAGCSDVDLSTTLGYTLFYPNAKTGVDGYCGSVCVYLPREDVKAGDGMFYLCTEKDGVVFSTAFSDETWVHQDSMSEEELVGMYWGGGVCFEVMFPVSLSLDAQYFINMEAGCIVTEDGSVTNVNIGGTDSVKIDTTCDFGVSEMRYVKVPAKAEEAQEGDQEEAETEAAEEEIVAQPAVGDQVRFWLKLEGDAVCAALYCYGGSVYFPETTLTESCEVIGEIASEEVAWGVVFLDEDGVELSVLEFGKN